MVILPLVAMTALMFFFPGCSSSRGKGEKEASSPDAWMTGTPSVDEVMSPFVYPGSVYIPGSSQEYLLSSSFGGEEEEVVVCSVSYSASGDIDEVSGYYQEAFGDASGFQGGKSSGPFGRIDSFSFLSEEGRLVSISVSSPPSRAFTGEVTIIVTVSKRPK